MELTSKPSQPNRKAERITAGPPKANAPNVFTSRLLDTTEKNSRQGNSTKYTSFSIVAHAAGDIQKRRSR